METTQRQLRYGVLYAAAAAAAGLAYAYYIAPTSNLEPWKIASYVYLDLHGFQVQETNIDTGNHLWIYPVATISTATILTNISMGRTRKLEHLVKNAGYVAVSYLVILTGLVFASNADPTITFAAAALTFLMGSLYIGSTFLSKAIQGIHVFALVGIGGVFILGVVILVAGAAILQALVPLAITTAAGAAAGTIFTKYARNTEW